MSLTIVGLLVAAISTFLRQVGVDIGPEALNVWVLTTGQIGGGLLAWYGRVRKGDINWLGIRK